MLYLIALLEWFTTLAVQMIALRLATPIVGSSIILTSVFIGIILLALSAGYYAWWRVASKYSASKLRVMLAGFLLFSGLYYGAITFATQEHLLEMWLGMTNNYILTLFVVALLLFFIPVFIDAQTIPLLTELLPESSKGKAAGSMLFASTIWSFLWSVGTSIWLFEHMGVRNTGILTCVILFACAIMLLWKKYRKRARTVIVGGLFFSRYMRSVQQTALDRISGLLYHHDSAYQEILIREQPRKTWGVARIFHTNRSFASGIMKDTKESPFDYLIEVMQLTDLIKPKRVLVIGTAWFTYPYQLSKLDYVEQVDAVDIDGSIKDIAEKYFLEETLSNKITFIPQSARYVVNQAVKNGTKYDLILIDAYNGKTLPDELATIEFFAGLKKLTTPEGIMANFILDSDLDSDLATNILTSRRHIFGDVWTKNVSNNSQKTFDNFIITAVKPTPDYTNFTNIWQLYTDDRRTTETDLVSMWRGK
jgi:spermidine synthase